MVSFRYVTIDPIYRDEKVATLSVVDSFGWAEGAAEHRVGASPMSGKGSRKGGRAPVQPLGDAVRSFKSVGSPPLTPVAIPSDRGEGTMELGPLKLSSLGIFTEEVGRKQNRARIRLAKATPAGDRATKKRNSLSLGFMHGLSAQKAAANQRASTTGSSQAGAPAKARRQSLPRFHGYGTTESGEIRMHAEPYKPQVPHTNLHKLHGDVIPISVLIRHSPFAYALAHKGPEGAMLLDKLTKAFSVVRFGRGDTLPDSPFYMVMKGSVRATAMSDGRAVNAIRCAHRS